MLDKDTKDVLTEGDQLKHLTEQSGWVLVRKRLMDKVMDLGSVLGLTTKEPQQLAIEIAARQLATTILIEWFKEIEGKVEQHNSNADILHQLKTDYLIEIKPD